MQIPQYTIPDAARSHEQAQKLEHEDLPEVGDFDLWREEQKLQYVLTWQDAPHPWFLERYQAVRAEQRRRARR